MTKRQAEIILAYAKGNMNTKSASEKVFMCRQNVRYHLRAIRKQMGRDPCNFFDLCYLVGIAVQKLGPDENQDRP